jgi:polyferredoxin
MAGPALRRFRLACQVGCLALFVLLLLRTAFHGSIRSAAPDPRIPYPVGLFLETDPLVALATALSTGTLYRHLWWAVPFVLLALVVGRAFCGWVCPLGTLQHWVGTWRSDVKRGARLVESNRYKRWQAAKYYVLAGVLALAAAGSAAGLLLDPISLLVRSMTAAVLPAMSLAVRAGLETISGWPLGPARVVVDTTATVFNLFVLGFEPSHFHQAFVVGGLFVLVLAAGLRVTRFWCRALCPLGALLGVCSRWSLVQLRKQDDRCDDCRRCLLHCQGGDDPIPGVPWRKAECHLCLNCVDDCPTHGISFAWSTRPSPATREVPQLQRRAVVTGLVAGAGLLPLVRSGPGVRAAADPGLIRPPGSLDEPHFLERCIRCGACMKVCPTNALHPSLLEAGLEGLWSPVLVPRIGYCEPNCVLCSQVCPTGAIWELTVSEKVGRPVSAREGAGGSDPALPARDPVRIGTAFYDRGRCLPWAMGIECIVCEEWCPTAPKAIYLVPAEVAGADGRVKTVRQPYVEPRRCTGCGACEFACPVKGRPAIYVTSAGETRSRANQFLLPENQPRARSS